MRLKTEDGEKWIVWMGPKSFLDTQKLSFKVGDKVQVRGLKYKSDIMIAAKITKGDLSMVLRSETDGLPVWPKK